MNALLLRALVRLGWHPGFRSEASFWSKELALEGEHREFTAKTLDPARQAEVFPTWLEPFLDDLAKTFPEPLRALDVGSGPVSLLEYGRRRGRLELTCADPLAARYSRLLAKHGHPVPVRFVTCFGEELLDEFPPQSFHLTFTSNALDHSQDPGEVVRQMAAVTAAGGLVVVQGYVREGTAERFSGLHRHDLWLGEGGALLCQTRGRRPRNLLERTPLQPLWFMPPTQEIKSYLRAVYRKPN